MQIQEFEIVDLGVAKRGTFELWGPSFALFTDAIVGEGKNGDMAIRTALDELATMGFETSEIEERARRDGYFGKDAETSLAEVLEGDDVLKEGECAYYVGIRFEDPNTTTEEGVEQGEKTGDDNDAGQGDGTPA